MGRGSPHTQAPPPRRLSLSLLGRLDRFAEGEHDLHRPAQCIARDWDAYLDLVREGAGDATVLDFATPSFDVLEPCQPPPASAPDASPLGTTIPRFAMRADDYSVWWSDLDECFVTNFAPLPGFDGQEQGSFGEIDYERHCTDEEAELERVQHDIEIEEARCYVEQIRRAWFGLDEEEEEDAEDDAEEQADASNLVGPDPEPGQGYPTNGLEEVSPAPDQVRGDESLSDSCAHPITVSLE